MRTIPHNPEQARRTSVIKSVSTRVTLIVAVVLSIGKLAGWLLTGSIVLLASAIDALVDTGASIVTLWGVRYAQQPPDRDHRFGHGKGEAVAAFTQASFLGGALEIGFWLIGASLLAALGLVVMQTWAVSRTGSTAIAADRAHYLADIALNAAVLLALAVTHWTGWTRADPAFALVISAYMLRNAYAIAREALEQLLDQELPAQDRRRIKDAVRACLGVRDIHDLRTRFSGDRTFVEYHLEVDPGLTVEVGHAIGDATETAVQNLLPGTVEATAHIEPHGIEDERLDDAIAQKSSVSPRS
jgi:divalent metal cation (Fe/Co/Zn/Cd) transporter